MVDLLHSPRYFMFIIYLLIIQIVFFSQAPKAKESGGERPQLRASYALNFPSPFVNLENGGQNEKGH